MVNKIIDAVREKREIKCLLQLKIKLTNLKKLFKAFKRKFNLSSQINQSDNI